VADEWEALCTTLGRDIEVTVGDRRLKGRAEALDADGSLLLRTRHGHLERVTGGMWSSPLELRAMSSPEMLLLLDIGNTHTHVGWRVASVSSAVAICEPWPGSRTAPPGSCGDGWVAHL